MEDSKIYIVTLSNGEEHFSQVSNAVGDANHHIRESMRGYFAHQKMEGITVTGVRLSTDEDVATSKKKIKDETDAAEAARAVLRTKILDKKAPLEQRFEALLDLQGWEKKKDKK
jgi:hypothetical protein